MDEKIRKLVLFRNEYEQAMRKIAKEYWYDKILESSELWEEYVPEVYAEDFGKWAVKRGGNARYKYIMITVNFKEDVSFETMWVKFVKMKNKIWIEKSMSCVEWRDKNKGMHIHSKVWVHDWKKVYECKREIYNTFKALVGNKMHVNVRYSNREKCFEDYIRGFRGGKKKESYDVTMSMRKELKIPDILEDIL